MSDLAAVKVFVTGSVFALSRANVVPTASAKIRHRERMSAVFSRLNR